MAGTTQFQAIPELLVADHEVSFVTELQALKEAHMLVARPPISLQFLRLLEPLGDNFLFPCIIRVGIL